MDFRLRARLRVPQVSGSLAVSGDILQETIQPTGLTFPSNLAADSDIRLVWDGSALLPRRTHTAIWRFNHVQHTGYYAVAWHADLTGTFDGGGWSYGTHPYPTDTGAVNGLGESTAGTSSAGTIHYYEIAKNARDYLATAGGSGLITTKGVWVTQARTCADLGGGSYRHTFWPDLEGNPNYSIVVDNGVDTDPGTPAFYFGASDWREGQGGAGRNDECPSGTLRGISMFGSAISKAHIDAIAALDSDAAVLAYCSANSLTLHYLNTNPTPTDVTDKSGAGHDPRWDNARRPTLYEG